jgi:hypothetical protein
VIGGKEQVVRVFDSTWVSAWPGLHAEQIIEIVGDKERLWQGLMKDELLRVFHRTDQMPS